MGSVVDPGGGQKGEDVHDNAVIRMRTPLLSYATTMISSVIRHINAHNHVRTINQRRWKTKFAVANPGGRRRDYKK